MGAQANYNHDNTDLIGMDEDFLEFGPLEEELLQLTDAAVAIESFGINPCAVMMMSQAGLLAGTSLETIALESFRVHKHSDVESQMAVEALLDKVKEKVATWSAKIVSLFSTSGTKVLELLKSLTERVKKAGEGAKEKVAASQVRGDFFAKVHPYKALVGAIAAAGAVTQITRWAVGSLPSFKESDKLPAFMKNLVGKINQIKWPFGEVKSTLASGGKKVKVTVVTAGAVAGAGSLAALGWTKNSVDYLIDHSDEISDGITSTWDNLGTKMTAVTKDVGTISSGTFRAISEGASKGFSSGVEGPNDTMGLGELSFRTAKAVAGAGLATFLVGVISVSYVLFRLIKSIVCMGMHLLSGTFHKLMEASASKSHYI